MRKVVNLNQSPSAIHIITQLAISFGITMLSALAISYLGIFLAAFISGTPAETILTQITSGNIGNETIIGFKIIQVFSQIGTFILPALILPVIFFKINPYKYTALTGKAPLLLYVMAVLSFYAFMPFVELVISLNQQMDLPAFFQDIEDWMRESEVKQGKLMNYFVVMPTMNDFLINIFVVAVVPAVAEELFFRGFLQRTIYNWWGKKHLAVFMAAFIFSSIHMQFFGFFPRFLLGIFLGYLLVWSGDLKLSILVHFLQNFTSLLIAYLYQDNIKNFDINAQTFEYPFYVYVVSALAGGFLLFQLYKLSRKRNSTAEESLFLETGDIQWTKAFSSQSIYEAEIVAGNLESEGIAAVVINKKDSSYGFGIVEVHVHADDAERAKQLISSFEL